LCLTPFVSRQQSQDPSWPLTLSQFTKQIFTPCFFFFLWVSLGLHNFHSLLKSCVCFFSQVTATCELFYECVTDSLLGQPPLFLPLSHYTCIIWHGRGGVLAFYLDVAIEQKFRPPLGSLNPTRPANPIKIIDQCNLHWAWFWPPPKSFCMRRNNSVWL
jgi:hypothetical protein